LTDMATKANKLILLFSRWREMKGKTV